MNIREPSCQIPREALRVLLSMTTECVPFHAMNYVCQQQPVATALSEVALFAEMASLLLVQVPE